MNLKNLKPREEAMENIENYISKNRLKTDDKLPAERAMCDMWNLNRSTLRSAIKQLILDGKIYSKNNSGTYVAREKFVRNLQDAKGLQQAAEAAGRIVTTRVLEFEVMEASKELGKKMKVLLGHKLYRIKRVRLLDGIPAVLSTIYLDAERFPGLDYNNLSAISLYGTLKEKYGAEVKSGMEKLSISYCDGEEAGYLGVKEGLPVIYQSGVSMDESDTIIEYFKEITLTEYICFASELTRK